MIVYEISPYDPEKHLFKVVLTLKSPDSKGEILYMPAWLPGSYLLRDFSKHIISLKATSNGVPIQVHKLDNHTYQCAPTEHALEIEYEIYAWDRSVRGAHLDLTHGFFNGSALCLCPMSQADQAMQLALHKPPRTYQEKPWSVATSMPTKQVDEFGFGTYEAQNYETLIDYPFEMGTFVKKSFQVAGVEHTLACTGIHQGDLNRLIQDVEKICQTYADFFGGLPFEQYTFLLTLLEEGYGGLEHLNSAALMCQKKCLPVPNMKAMGKDYRILLGLFSHEYFHAWHVKRIKPLEFVGADLRYPKHSKQLWVFEGITSYYDEWMLLRAGCIDVTGYCEMLAENITRLTLNEGRRRQSLKESSFDAWIKFYQPHENTLNTVVSYYTKGAMCALLFDLHIRQTTQNRACLDDVMLSLWKAYGAVQKGVPEGAVENCLIEFGTDSIKPLLHLALETTEELPLTEMLEAFGVALTYEYPEAINTLREDSPVSLGITFENTLSLKIKSLTENGAAQKAGLSAHDRLVALDHCEIKRTSLSDILRTKKPGDQVLVHVFREERLLAFELTFQASPKTQARCRLIETLSEEQSLLRKAWLGV